MDIWVSRLSLEASFAIGSCECPQYGQRDEPAQIVLSQWSQRKVGDA